MQNILYLNIQKNTKVITVDCTDEVPEPITVGYIHERHIGWKVLKF
jgi:hypothetical protein